MAVSEVVVAGAKAMAEGVEAPKFERTPWVIGQQEPLGYRVEPSGKVVPVELPPEIEAQRQADWIAWLDGIASRPPDPDFMKERPMNQIPVERDLFPDE